MGRARGKAATSLNSAQERLWSGEGREGGEDPREETQRTHGDMVAAL